MTGMFVMSKLGDCVYFFGVTHKNKTKFLFFGMPFAILILVE